MDGTVCDGHGGKVVDFPEGKGFACSWDKGDFHGREDAVVEEEGWDGVL